MQRLCSKLRCLGFHSNQTLGSLSLPASRGLLHRSFTSTRSTWSFNSLKRNAASPRLAFTHSPLTLSLVQVRHVSSRERAKRRKPMTPRTSKIKKIKIKSFSSFKSRFRTMKDGNIRRWREGKNHNAHLKSKKSRRRLRQPAIVPAAYAKVMKKLNFCG